MEYISMAKGHPWVVPTWMMASAIFRRMMSPSVQVEEQHGAAWPKDSTGLKSCWSAYRVECIGGIDKEQTFSVFVIEGVIRCMHTLMQRGRYMCTSSSSNRTSTVRWVVER